MSSSPLLARLLGDPVKAGDLYYRKGNYRRAAEMYAKGGRFDQAARMCRELGDREGAVRFYELGQNFLEAGELLAEDGAFREALPFFEKARAWDSAARTSLKLGSTQRAARYFEKAGKGQEAAACFERAGEIPEALAALNRESKRLELRYRQSGAPELESDLKRVDLRRAGFLEKLKQPEAAAEILLHWGDKVRAGELLLQAGQTDRAARAFIEGAAPDRALEILDETCDISPEEKAKILRLGHRWHEAAEAFREAGQFADAAEAYEEFGEAREAAVMWEQSHELQRAADLYFRAESWRDAARCFSAVGRHDLAARAYEKVPDHAQAAACHLRWGNFMDAGQQFLEIGDTASASKSLQQVTEDQPEYDAATLLLVPFLIEDGLAQGALHRLERLDIRPGAGPAGLERLYWEGRALESIGRSAEARERFERLAAVRKDHRDVMERLQNLEPVSGRTARQAFEAGTPPSGSPGFRAGLGAPPLSQVVEPGAILSARYLLEEEIGRGGMGRVYRAKDLELDELVAIKTVLSKDGQDASAEYERLLREVQICRRITHPNVVRVFDLGRIDGGIYITMEYLEGETLDKLMKREGQLPLEQVKTIAHEILSGLHVAHDLKVVHRDLKPSNVFLTSRGVKVLDFGIARMEGIDVDLTTAGEVLGSPKYMSPEQIQGDPLDGRTDLYSLGILLYYMLAGREPFRGKTPSLIAVKQLREAPPPLLERRSDLPESWLALVDHLLAKDRGERIATASDVIGALGPLPVE